jgi:type I restriction enzyme S subunit
MSYELREYVLEDLVDFTNGNAFKSKDYVEKSVDTYEVLRMGYIKRGGGFKEDERKVYAPKSIVKNIERFLLRKNDIVMAMTDMKDNVAILGNTALVNFGNRFVVNQRVGVLRVKNERILDPVYLYYLTNNKTNVDELRARANSGVQVNLSTEAIKKTKYLLPPYFVQKKISFALHLLYKKIELIQDTNTTLAAIAQAIFKSWFVDFDPVHAKQQGVECAGIDTATADLFPSSFVQSELGLIPEGWTVKGLDDIATYLNGLALQKFPPQNNESLPVIKIAQLRKGDTDGADKAGTYIKPEYIVKDGDVLFSWSGTLEVDIWCGGDGALNQHLFKVSSTSFSKWFYYYWTKYYLAEFRRIAEGKATTMGHIQRAHLTNAKVLVPPLSLLKAMDNIFNPLVSKMISNAINMKTLASLRNTLLPRLMSGKLNLSEIEEQLEGVA